MKYIYVDSLDSVVWKKLSNIQAFSYKNLNKGIWLFDKKFTEFLENFDFKLYNDILSFSFNNYIISYKTVRSKNHVYKFTYYKNFSKILFYDIDKFLKDIKQGAKEFPYKHFLEVVYKNMFDIKYDSLTMISEQFLIDNNLI